MKAMLFILPALVLAATVAFAIYKVRRGASPKKMVCMNLAAAGVLLVMCGMMAMTVSAEGTAANSSDVATTAAPEAAEEKSADGLALGLGLLAAGRVTGMPDLYCDGACRYRRRYRRGSGRSGGNRRHQ